MNRELKRENLTILMPGLFADRRPIIIHQSKYHFYWCIIPRTTF